MKSQKHGLSLHRKFVRGWCVNVRREELPRYECSRYVIYRLSALLPLPFGEIRHNLGKPNARPFFVFTS